MSLGKADKFCWALAAFILGFGIFSLSDEQGGWLMAGSILYALPLMLQFFSSGVVKSAGLWFGAFLILQTLMTPFIPKQAFITLPPDMNKTMNVVSGITGVSGLQTVITDEYGFRTTKDINYEADDTFRIFTIGGSTTEQIDLGNHRTWSHLLQQQLDQESGASVEVINTGVSGLRMRNHLATLEYVLDLNPDMVVFLVGINDWNYQVRESNAALSEQLEELAAEKPPNPKDYYIHLLSEQNEPQTFGLSSTLLGKLFIRLFGASAEMSSGQDEPEAEDTDGTYYTTQAGSLDRTPVIAFSVDRPHESYLQDLQKISSLCVDNQIVCLFVTQPTGYKVAASSSYKKSFWMTPPNERYSLSFDTMVDIASMYNKHLQDFAQSENHPVCDIASHLEPSHKVFFDDCHFNEAGSVQVSKLLHSCITQNAAIALP